MEGLGIVNYFGFLAAGVLLNLLPGPDTVYILSHSLTGGRRAGLLSALGIATGGIVHTVAAACGISLLIGLYPVLFGLLQAAGVVILVYFGIKALVAPPPSFSHRAETPLRSPLRVYGAAVAVNVFNPKVALFFLSFLPQFIEPGRGNMMVSFLLLGMTFVTTGTLWSVVLVFAASWMMNMIAQRRSPRTIHLLVRVLPAALFVGLAVNLAVSTWS